MKKTIMGLAGMALLIAVAFTACNKKDDNGTTDNFDRKALLTNYADNYVTPAYQEMVAKMNTLKQDAAAFTAAPDEPKLLALQNSWKDAYLTWQKVELLEFGPAENVSLRMYINIYPVSETKVNNNIASGSYDLDAFGNKDAQGFPALDLLINGTGATAADIVSYYNTGSLATNRKNYLMAVVNKMTDMITGVQSAWAGYKDAFVESTGVSANSSLSQLVNSYVLYYERYLRSGKIGLPVGAMAGTPSPGLTEANYSPALSKDLAVAAMKAVRQFYEGMSYDGTNNGVGMRDYLAAIGTKDEQGKLMSDVVAAEMDEATTALEGLNGTIKDAVTNNRPAVLSVYDQLQNVVPLLKVDMVSAFGISITYVDNDGD